MARLEMRVEKGRQFCGFGKSRDAQIGTLAPQSVYTHLALLLFITSVITIIMSDCVLPGQPIPLPKGPVPRLGRGIYTKDGQVRAGLIGSPHYDGSVGLFSRCLYFGLPKDGSLCSLLQTLIISRVKPHPPAPNSIVLGSVTRLSPIQALLSISVVDGVPLPVGEEFTGVIRVQDVRATEKDKVKISDCFRGLFSVS